MEWKDSVRRCGIEAFLCQSEQGAAIICPMKGNCCSEKRQIAATVSECLRSSSPAFQHPKLSKQNGDAIKLEGDYRTVWLV